MSNIDDKSCSCGCILIVVVIAIVCYISEVYGLGIFLVLGGIVAAIGWLLADVSFDDRSKHQKQDDNVYDVLYGKTSSDHHIRLNKPDKSTPSIVYSDKEFNRETLPVAESGIDDNWSDDDDDSDDNFLGRHQKEENLFVDKDIMLTREEYHRGKAAINKLMKLIKRMSNDSSLREATIGYARDNNTVEGEYDPSNFYWTLRLYLANDIIYCYENMGLNTVMLLDTPENQLLIPITLAIVENKENDNYADFKRELLSMDPLWEAMRDTHEEMYKVLRDHTGAKVTAEGVDDFQLVLLVKVLNFENKYLIELREDLYEMAETIADIAGMNERMKMILENFRLRLENDEEELKTQKDKSQVEEQVAAQDDEHMPTFDDLNTLIGLNQVKKEVMAMKIFIEVNRRREEAGLKTLPTSYHCVFTGNPGTGKTTVARIVAGIYKELGILKKGHLVETDRSGLIAEYVGQTAVKTNKIIDSALDGVLFIDEAYSLIGGGKEDFGKEAIATLVKRMEDDRERLVVILAGYDDEMKQFIESNPGLRSRFNRYIHFEDYSADELKQIFQGMLQKYDFVLQEEAEQVLEHHLERCVAVKTKDFGNARYVRNLFEHSIKAQAVRLAEVPENDKPQLSTITVEDINIAIADNP